MSIRRVSVLHLLFPRRIGGETQVFLHTHRRWRSSGGPLLALPTTGMADHARSGAPLGDCIRAVFNVDLKLPEDVPQRWQPFATIETHAVSPGKGVPSDYHISPVLTRLPAVAHGRAVAHAGGCWLSPRAALARPDLSPTARAVLVRVAAYDLLPPPPPAEELEAGGNRAVAARLTAARDGDMDQFAAVVRQLEPELAVQLRRNAHTRELASRSHDLEDVLADTFTSALKHLERFDPERGAAGWLWTIAYHNAISRLRRAGADPLPPEVSDPRSGESDPSAAMAKCEERAELCARVASALARVTPRMRRAWEMHFVEELPYKVIAKTLKVPVGTLATWFARIRQLVHDAGRGER